MKLLTTFITLLITLQLSFAEGSSSFKFIKTRIETNSTKVFFSLEKEISFELLKNNLIQLDGVNNCEISEQGYISIEIEAQNNNDAIRQVIISLGSDIDKKFIIVSKKSYYNK